MSLEQQMYSKETKVEYPVNNLILLAKYLLSFFKHLKRIWLAF